MRASLVPRLACMIVLALAAGCRPGEAPPSSTPEGSAAPAVEGSAAAAPDVVAPPTQADTAATPDPGPAVVTTLDFDARVAASEALAPTTAPQTVGAVTLVATPCAFVGYTFLDDSSMDVIGAFEVVGEFAYIIDRESNLRRFGIDVGEGCTLTADPTFGAGGVMDFERDIETVSSSSDGLIVVSNGVFESWTLDGPSGARRGVCDARSHGYVTMNPAGGWGLGRYLSPEVRRVSFDGAGCTDTPWSWSHPFHGVSAIGFVGDQIVAGGPILDEVNGRRPQQLVAFNADGNELWRQGNTDQSFADDGYGWFHAIEACPWGICVLDSNFRSLHIVSTAGVHLGRVDLSALLGLRYAWYADIDVVGDTLWIVAGQERGDSDVYEGLMYRITPQGE